MRLAWLTGICGALLAVALMAGCKQEDGERCQIDSDCEEGLICCVLPNKQTKGTCREKSRCTATDSGVPDITVQDDGKTADKTVVTPDKTVVTPDKTVVTPDVTPDKAVVKPDVTPDKAVVKPDATSDTKASAG